MPTKSDVERLIALVDHREAIAKEIKRTRDIFTYTQLIRIEDVQRADELEYDKEGNLLP